MSTPCQRGHGKRIHALTRNTPRVVHEVGALRGPQRGADHDLSTAGSQCGDETINVRRKRRSEVGRAGAGWKASHP